MDTPNLYANGFIINTLKYTSSYTDKYKEYFFLYVVFSTYIHHFSINVSWNF